jgi:hypothetical protein
MFQRLGGEREGLFPGQAKTLTTVKLMRLTVDPRCGEETTAAIAWNAETARACLRRRFDGGDDPGNRRPESRARRVCEHDRAEQGVP